MARKKSELSQNEYMFPSNHQNVLFMLAAGLITGPGGFEYAGESKYYKDILCQYPGMIPLYKDYMPYEAISAATDENANLLPVVAVVDMGDYSGDKHLCAGGNMILVPAPLPVSWITRVLLKNETDLSMFKSAAANYGNVDIGDIPLKLSDVFKERQPEIMSGSSETDVPAGINNIIPQGKPQAFGGIITMLYRLANKSDFCLSVYQKAVKVLTRAYDYEPDLCIDTEDPVISHALLWLADNDTPITDERASFFYGLLGDIVKNRSTGSPFDITAKARRYVFDYINSNNYLKDKLSKLSEEIQKPQYSLTEQFDRFKGTVSHALLLFFRRESCEELLRFIPQNPAVMLNDTDLIAAALLFGARDGWIGLPNEHRQGMTKWVTHIMALSAHNTDKPVIRINTPAPEPLRALLSGDIRDKKCAEAARVCNWDDCLQTAVKLPRDYRVENGYLILAGRTERNIDTVIDKGLFLDKLSSVTAEEEQKIRKILNGNKK